MLGVGSSISSVVENKYNISLNGTSDYINIDTFTQHADLTNGMAWSLAVWFKGNGNATSGAHTNILFSAHASNADNRLRIGIDADGSKGVYYSDAQATQADIGGVDLDDGNWHLVVISRPSGLDQQVTVYIDGAAAGTVANTEVLWDGDLTFASIGQEYDPASPTVASDFFGGEIAQLAFWKTELLRDDASAIYNAGRNADLNAPQTDYQNHGSIIGYWKMGDGLFDDRVNGVIHDQSNPGFGSELLLNADFSAYEAEAQANLIGGVQFDDWLENTQSGKATFTSIDSGFRRTVVDPTTSSWHQRVNQNLHETIELNKMYRFMVSYLTSNGHTMRIAIQNPGSTDLQSGGSFSSTAGIRHSYENIFKCDVVSDIDMDIFSSANQDRDVYYEISNISLVKLNGAPGEVVGATFVADN